MINLDKNNCNICTLAVSPYLSFFFTLQLPPLCGLNSENTTETFLRTSKSLNINPRASEKDREGEAEREREQGVGGEGRKAVRQAVRRTRERYTHIRCRHNEPIGIIQQHPPLSPYLHHSCCKCNPIALLTWLRLLLHIRDAGSNSFCSLPLSLFVLLLLFLLSDILLPVRYLRLLLLPGCQCRLPLVAPFPLSALEVKWMNVYNKKRRRRSRRRERNRWWRRRRRRSGSWNRCLPRFVVWLFGLGLKKRRANLLRNSQAKRADDAMQQEEEEGEEEAEPEAPAAAAAAETTGSWKRNRSWNGS